MNLESTFPNIIADYLHVSTPTIARVLDAISPTHPSSLPTVIALMNLREIRLPENTNVSSPILLFA